MAKACRLPRAPSPELRSRQIQPVAYGLINKRVHRDLERAIFLSAPEGEAADFRNPNGVYMKLMNFRRFDPVYQAQGKTGLTRGNKLEETVWNDFASDPVRLAKTAAAIGANIETPSNLR